MESVAKIRKWRSEVRSVKVQICKNPKMTLWKQARNQGAQGGRSPLEKCSTPLEKCVGHSFKMLDIVQKIKVPLGKLFAPPGVPSWLRVCLRVRSVIHYWSAHDHCVCCCLWRKSVELHGILKSCLAGGNRIINCHRQTNRNRHNWNI